MKYVINFLLVIVFLFSNYLQAQDALPPAKIKVSLGVASNYVSKGADKFSDYALQKKKSYGSHTGAPVFKPLLEYNVPEPGIFFKLLGFIALDGRADQDVDGFVQRGPAGADLLLNAARFDDQVTAILDNSGLLDSSGNINSVNTNLNGSLLYPDCLSTITCLPNFYDEQNGLYRSEEVKAFMGYKRKTSIGKFSFALKFTIPVHKDVDRTTAKAIVFDYSLPGLKQLIFYMEHTLKKSDDYYQIKWKDRVSIMEIMDSDLKLEYWGGVAYGVKSNLQGVRDVTGRIGAYYQGFRLGANIAWRPDLRFHDTDKQSVGSDALPVWVYGNSSRADGRVADPSRLYGYYNQYINTQIQNAFGPVNTVPGYTYTPRQSLPRYLLWVDFSYTFFIQ